MGRDRFIGDPVWERIEQELDAIEREHQVRVLLAVESGSRAWRFPSPDSDYDVRFLYARRVQAYLSVEPVRDVIERPIDDVLDISGWDLRKALQLLVRSNAVLLEWLSSTVWYREQGDVAGQVHRLARETCSLPSLAYHYDRLARHSFDQITSADGPVKLKTYCYALRPALALLWMRAQGTPPPMDLPSLLAGVSLPAEVSDAIAMLVERKASARERDVAERIPALDAFLADVLAVPATSVSLHDRAGVIARADALFASVVLDRSNGVPDLSTMTDLSCS